MSSALEAAAALSFSQAGRAITVETVLGPDVLLLQSFEGEEEIAGGFRYSLRMLSKDPAVSAAKLIRTAASVCITMNDGSTRYINGLISRFAQLETTQGLTSYEADLRPWFWFLSLGADFRVYQEMTIPDIVKKVCKDQGFSDIVGKFVKQHPPHEYRVQYGETHLDFIQRLMEEEGIFWFADFTGKRCNLMISDDNSVAKQVVKLRMTTSSQESEDDSVLQNFTLRREACAGKYSSLDYNFETPSTQLLGDAGKGTPEVMEYPGGQATRDDATRLSRIRQEEELAEEVEAEGVGKNRALHVGIKVEIADPLGRGLAGTYLVTSVTQSARLGEFRSGGDAGVAYASSFTAVPFATPYRPPRETALPRAYGYDSAVVVGPAGEEIFTDKYGRVKVQFFWDREGKKNDKSSCWVRVSTVWAGKGWGVISTPRIGQEVLVAYLNGDPDEPIIIGRVYNAEQMPPYALPSNKTQSGIKTRSTLGGSPDNFNEIRFEDKKGSEQLFIHGEKNVDIEVENDETHWVGHDRTKKVDRNETTTIGKDRSENVGANETISIGGTRSETVGKDESISVSGSRSLTVSKDDSASVGKDRSSTVAKNDTLDIGESSTVTIGKDLTISIGANRATTIAKADTLDVGKELTITVADAIIIKTGEASISMKKNGDIVIKGNNITVDGSGKIAMKASSDLSMKGSKVTAN
jgi:type VI secretion system secreted protein VgrG